jgi:TonB family protein
MALLAAIGGALSRPARSAQLAQAVDIRQSQDVALEGVQSLVGRAMFLRGCYASDNLAYDASGQVRGEPKQVDWTLAGANIEKVERRSGGPGSGGGELELDGERVAMRYNPDQHQFERHVLKDRKLKILLDVNAEARGLQGALATTATGSGLEFPVPEKKLEPEFTNEAREDHVKGIVVVRLTVGTDGVPRRIAIKQPLGYGLDARVVETVARYRFHPGTKNGNPVAVEMLVNQAFDYYAQPGR